MDNQDLEVYQDPLDQKEKLVLGVRLVSLVLQDFPDHEVKEENLETRVARGHKEFQVSQDQAARLDLPVYQD